MKTRLGISVGMAAAATYFAALFGGYTVLTLFVGYILLIETNPWLRKTAVKAFVVCLLFSLINVVIGIIPGALNMVWDVLNIFEVNTSWMYKVNAVMNIFQTIINGLRTVLLLVLGFMSFNQSTIPLGPIDNMIHKHM
jgi:hypothetical protein